MRSILLIVVVGIGAAMLGSSVGVSTQQRTASPMNTIAERYVKLVLAVGEHDPAYVDAYYGPPEWKTQVAARKQTLAQIETEAAALAGLLGAAQSGEDIDTLRHTYLRRQIEAVRARLSMLSGTRMSFDEESRALYDAVAPSHPEAYFQATVDELDRMLPGSGPVIDRLEGFRTAFVVPKERLKSVFDTAIAECRRRTLAHVALPADESFTVEFVTNKSWSGYNWYQGDYRSLIQVNTDLPIYIDRAVDLACHEGYPGHHVYNLLLERNLVRNRGWVEMSVYPLFSPQSLIAEGSANYGIDVAFPGGERVAFERDVLFPAAGLDPARAAEYYRVQAIVERLSYAGNEAARRYLNGEIDRAAAAAWITRFALMSPARAEQRTRFMDDYRSYVINYNLGKDLVRQFVESRSGSGADSARRWQVFSSLLETPRLPSGLATSR